jgi:DNA-binding MarR family transcriptional regulator
MNEDEFARTFEELFRATYANAVRRIRDKRERPSAETVALLNHLALSGPLTLSEMGRHFSRAESTLSEVIDHLEAKGWLERDRDPADRRRVLVWLGADGQAALAESTRVLDQASLAQAAARLAQPERADLLRLFTAFVRHLKEPIP